MKVTEVEGNTWNSNRLFADHCRSLSNKLAFAFEFEYLQSLVDGDPTYFIDFMVVIRTIAVHMTHKKKMHELMNASSAMVPICREPVFDGLEWSDDLGRHAGLFPNLSQSCLLKCFAFVDQAFGQLPTLLRDDHNDHDLNVRASASIHNTSRRDLVESWHDRFSIYIVHLFEIASATA